MKNKWQRITQPSVSELRGIFLVIIGSAAQIFYFSWWFQESRLTSPWLIAGFIVALLYSGVQIIGNWLTYLATHHRLTRPTTLADNLTVDVFVTAYDEDPIMIERCLNAVRAMHGNHQTWLLDDSNNPALAKMAHQLGAGYLTRTNHNNAKAGNLNAALAQTNGDIVVIFDIDHVPQPTFLEQTLGYFADPAIGFVQVMLTFGNNKDGWVAQAAGDSSLDFYNPISIGADGMHSATLVGSNALIRRKALCSIDGYKPGLAEDLATSISLHGHGWRSVYVAEPLAPGLAPPDLAAWFTQQLKWARGVFELLLTLYPTYFSRLKIGQRLFYAVRMTYYWIGPVLAIHIFLTIQSLLIKNATFLSAYQDYLFHLLPLGIMTIIIRILALRRWRHRSLKLNLQWKPITLVAATWPVYTLAWFMAILRLPLRFRATPKRPSSWLNPIWLLPQLLTVVLLLIGLYRHFAGMEKHPLLVLAFALGLILVHSFLFFLWLTTNFKTSRQRQSREHALSNLDKKRLVSTYLPKRRKQYYG